MKLHTDEEFVRFHSRRVTIVAYCKECGKEFERPTAEWGYAIDKDKYCTYKCMRAAEKRMMEE